MFLTIKMCTHAKLNFLKIELSICIKMDLALDNRQMLICHKTQPTNQNFFFADIFFWLFTCICQKKVESDF